MNFPRFFSRTAARSLLPCSTAPESWQAITWLAAVTWTQLLTTSQRTSLRHNRSRIAWTSFFGLRLPVRRLLCPLVASSALLVALPSLALTIKWTAGHTAYFEPAGETLGVEQRAGLEMLLNHVGLAPCRLDIVTVVGHADSIEAPAPARLALSIRRAEYVKGMLLRLGGVDPSKIYVEGRGSAQQLGRPGTRANRRVEIEAVGQAMSTCAKE